MGNTLKETVTTNNINTYTCINEADTHLLDKTQKRLKYLNNQLLLELTKVVAQADYECNCATPILCKTINRHLNKQEWVSFSNNKSEVIMKNFELEAKYIQQIKSNDDFICSYALKEEINTIWLIIKDATFKFNEKYLETAREFKKSNNCNFNLIIFDEDELDEINEQLEYMGDYEVYKKNA